MREEIIKNKTSIYVAITILITIIIMSTIAITMYFKLSKPEFYKTFIELGNKFLNESKYEEAILEFEKAIHIEPKRTEARVGNGKSYIGVNKVDNAIEEFKEAQNLDIENIKLLLEILEILKDIDSESAYDILQNYIDKTQNTIPDNIQEIINNSNDKPKNPIINPIPGTYINPINVKLELEKLVVGYTFYYTIDGSEPSKESIKYSGGIDVKGDTTIKLIAYNHKGESSEVMILEYKIDTKLRDEINNLINEATELMNSTEEGTNVGNCVKGAKESLEKTIENIKYKLKSEVIDYKKANDIQSTINSAIQSFKDKIIEDTDKNELKKVIDKAQSLHDNSTEGKEEGQYKVGSKATLLKSLDEVKKIYEDILSRQDDIDNAVNNLNNAIYNFENSKMKSLRELGTKYANRLMELELQEEMLSEQYMSLSNADMGAGLGEIQARYENIINDMYSDLEKYLPDNKLQNVKQDKNNFSNEKKATIDEVDKAIASAGHGTAGVTAYSSAIIDVSKAHGYYLINEYMN